MKFILLTERNGTPHIVGVRYIVRMTPFEENGVEVGTRVYVGEGTNGTVMITSNLMPDICAKLKELS